MKRWIVVLAGCWGVGMAPGGAQDMPLSQVLLPGEGWEVVSEGHGFADACAADAEGNFYFADVKSGKGIFRLSGEGKVELWLDGFPGVSGMQFGPEGKLYLCQGRFERLVRVEPESGAVEVLAEGVRPNDLVVTHRGEVYFTHTKPQRIELISPAGEHRVVHEGGLVRPNGITLSPDQGTLVVSDHGEKQVWAFRIEKDGSLAHPECYMTVRTPLGTEESRGDGAATDGYGRYYVTTAVGLQMFDPTGRLGGVMANPASQVVSVEFAGPDRAYLYVAGGDKIFRRKTQSRGILFEDGPVAALPLPGKG